MKKLLIIVALLFSILASEPIVPTTAQTVSVPIAIPVRGQYAVTGDLENTMPEVDPHQLFSIDTYLGDVRFLTRNDLFVDSPKWSSAGDQIAFQSGITTNIWHFSNGSETVLPLEKLCEPQSWSPDDSELLYSRYDSRTTPPTESLNVLTLGSMTSRTLFAYQEDQPLNNLPLPSLPPGVSQLFFYSFRKADWNPIYADWIVVEIDGTTAPSSNYGPDALVVPVTFLYNLRTGEMLSFDSLFTESVSNGQFAWSPDGQYLAIETSSSMGGTTDLVSFKKNGQNWALRIVKSAPSGYQVLVGWLGAGDLLLTGANDPDTEDKISYIAQIIDGQWRYTEFFRLPKSTFFRAGGRDWYITASEAEKQTLTCLFDQTMLAQLAAGMSGRVTFTGGTASRLRSEPGTNGTIVTMMPEGTPFEVVGGKWCVDGYRWWQIRLNDHTTGWAAEADENTYFLEPINPP